MADKPLRIGIVTDGLEQRVADGDVRIANGGVGVYIYNLVKQLQMSDATNEYVLVCCGGADLDIYRNGRTHTVALRASAMSRVARRLDLPYRWLARDLKLDLPHYPNQFGGAFLPRHVKRVVTLHDITPLLFPRYHPTERVLGYRLLNRAEVFAYPSLYEGFGLPMVEAMACGTPVVASNVSSLPEVAGKAALFADPTDAGAFAAKLRDIFDHPALRNQLIAEGRRQAARWSWTRTAEQTLAVYRTVCGRLPRSGRPAEEHCA